MNAPKKEKEAFKITDFMCHFIHFFLQFSLQRTEYLNPCQQQNSGNISSFRLRLVKGAKFSRNFILIVFF